jgi:hypothetical protein
MERLPLYRCSAAPYSEPGGAQPEYSVCAVAVQLGVVVHDRGDKGEVRKGLRAIGDLVVAPADLLGVRSDVVGKGEQPFEGVTRLFRGKPPTPAPRWPKRDCVKSTTPISVWVARDGMDVEKFEAQPRQALQESVQCRLISESGFDSRYARADRDVESLELGSQGGARFTDEADLVCP